MDLFSEPNSETAPDQWTPLAERLRPVQLDQVAGQTHLIGVNSALRKSIEKDDLVSMIFWGPPGVGKTTLAHVIANETRSEFHAISAVTAGVKDVRAILERARINRSRLKKRTMLFIDEIHRFNKAQQDALLHSVESGDILLIGATTENPGFEVISPLLSRCRVYKLEPLSRNDLLMLMNRALAEDAELKKKKIEFSDANKDILIAMAGGDARICLNGLELAAKISQPGEDGICHITQSVLEEALQRRTLLYDRNGDYHYDIISAFIKSVRGSDPDAAVYWLARMLDSGEDPKFIARRLIVLASEDIGNADPHALMLATAAFTAVDYIGMPEARIVLAQATTYLAAAPKSNAAYLAIEAANEDVKNASTLEVPLHLRNAPTRLMKSLGYADGYKYPHDFANHFVDQHYRPESAEHKVYYQASESGIEKKIKERLAGLWPKRYRKS